MKGQVNDSTTVNARLSTDNVNFKGDSDADVGMELLNVNHDFGAAALTLGRYGMTLGNQGGWLYNSSYGFDGAQLAADFGKVNVAVGYGQFNSARNTHFSEKLDRDDPANKGAFIDNHDTFYARANADLGAFDLYANYFTNMESKAQLDYDIWGVGLVIPVSQFRVFGEYWQDTTFKGEDDAWNAGIGYGMKDLKKPGTWSLDVAYNNVGEGVYLGGTGLQTDILSDIKSAGELKFWNAIADVTLAQNTYLHGEYAFAAEGEGAKGDPKDSWTVSLNYVF